MLSWLIYESDIYHIGGTVTYTGKVSCRRWTSYMESAYVTLGAQQVPCNMKRYKDGSSVIVSFTENGIPMQKNNSMVKEFLVQYENAKNSNPIYQEFVFYRSIAQVLTGFGQLFCFVSLWYLLSHIHNSLNYWTYIIPIVIASVLYILLCSCYSRIRTRDFKSFKSFVYSDDN